MKKLFILGMSLNLSLFASNVVSGKNFVLEEVSLRTKPSTIQSFEKVIGPKDRITIVKKVITKDCETWYLLKSGLYIQAKYVKPINEKLETVYETKKRCLDEDELLLNSIKKSKQLETKAKKVVKEEKELQNKQSKKIKVEKENKYFFAVGLGYSKFNSQKNDKIGAISLMNEMDDSGLNLNFELGYNYSMNRYISLILNANNFDNVNVYNYLLSYNYKFNTPYVNPYIGALVGFSYMDVKKSLTNLKVSDSDGIKFAYGLQAGLIKDISKKSAIALGYRYIKAEHKTLLEVDALESEIIRDDFSTIDLSYRYKF